MANPRAVPAKTLDYAKYDLVRVLNEGLDRLGLRGSVVEKMLARTLAVPAARFFRMRRSVSLLVAAGDDGDPGDRRRHLSEPDPGAVAARAAPPRVLDVTPHRTPVAQATELQSYGLQACEVRTCYRGSRSGISAAT